MARVSNPVGCRTLPGGRKILRQGAANGTRGLCAFQQDSFARIPLMNLREGLQVEVKLPEQPKPDKRVARLASGH
jgi:hypothetical protein